MVDLVMKGDDYGRWSYCEDNLLFFNSNRGHMIFTHVGKKVTPGNIIKA
jgi:hypothetical protein